MRAFLSPFILKENSQEHTVEICDSDLYDAIAVSQLTVSKHRNYHPLSSSFLHPPTTAAMSEFICVAKHECLEVYFYVIYIFFLYIYYSMCPTVLIHLVCRHVCFIRYPDMLSYQSVVLHLNT